MIKVDKKQLSAVIKKLESASRKVPKGIAYTLSDIAYGTRNAAIENIERQMVIRSKAFVHSKIIVTTAKPNKLESLIGAVKAKRFSLREQEFGGKSGNIDNRHINISARGGRRGRRVVSKARLMLGRKIIKATKSKKAVGLLRSLSRTKNKNSFILFNHPKVKPGLYKLKSGGRTRNKEMKGRFENKKLIQLQSFEKSTFARRRPWLKTAPAIFFRRVDKRRLISRNIGRHIKMK